MEFAEYIPFWDKLTAEQQEHLAGVVEHRKVKKGVHIHDSSADCLGLVMVKSGQLRAYILSEDGREITIGRLFEYDVSLLSASCVMPDLQFNIMIEADKDTEFWSIQEPHRRIPGSLRLFPEPAQRQFLRTDVADGADHVEELRQAAGCLPAGGIRH